MAWMLRSCAFAWVAGLLLAVGCGSDDEKPKSTAFGGSSGQGGSAGNAGSSNAGQGGSAAGGSAGSSAMGGSAGSGGSGAGTGGATGGSAGATGGAGGGDAAIEFTPQDDCDLCEQTDCATSLEACDNDSECSTMLECVAMGCELSQQGAGCVKTCMEAACSSSTSVQAFLDTLTCRYCNTACQSACGGLCANVSMDASSYICAG